MSVLYNKSPERHGGGAHSGSKSVICGIYISVKVGNGALAGAVSAALSEEARKEMARIQKMIRVIDLPTHPDFSDTYTEGMFFE